jgi:hypothetical protein
VVHEEKATLPMEKKISIVPEPKHRKKTEKGKREGNEYRTRERTIHSN